VTCHNCQIACNRFGKHRNGLQRFRCSQCRKTFTEDHAQPLNDMRLPMDKAVTVLKLLVEGMSIRSVERITGIHRDTIMRLLLLAGEKSARLLDAKMRNLRTRYFQCDEIWSYCFKKRARIRKGDSPEFGDQWVFIAMDAESKLIASFRVGKRTRDNTDAFMKDLYYRIAENHRTQITTDGFYFYKQAVPNAFGLDADFAQLTKMFGDYGQFDTPEARYSPPRISGVISKVRSGDPDPEHISTSLVERQNLTMRMQMRRFTRLTNAFSKKLSHLKAAVSLYFAWYNLCRIHTSLRVTPAMEAGITDRQWSLGDLLCQGGARLNA
jgi:transposase-like protein/IS1 family transposase